MATDNRTNEPTPEQVEAAAKAYQAAQNADPYDFKGRMRAALEAAARAAQGAASQAESAWIPGYGGTGVNKSAPVLLSSTCQHNMVSYTDSVSEKAENFCSLCGYQPSSGVDEDKLAEADVAPQEPSECSNPQCPLQRAHSGPCAPEGWSPDREKLAAEAREEFLPHSDNVWACDLVSRLADALAAPVAVDEAKLAEVIESSAAEWGDSDRIQSVLAQYIASAVAEWLKEQGGEIRGE